jgi:hypothetical protein
MPGGIEDLEQRFAAFVRHHGERHLRVAVLLLPRRQRAAVRYQTVPAMEAQRPAWRAIATG